MEASGLHFSPVSSYHDALGAITEGHSIGEKLGLVHQEMRSYFPNLSRVAVAIYEEERDLLKTFVYSGDIPTPLQFYQARLQTSESLSAIRHTGHARVVNDLSIYDKVEKVHSQRIGSSGYGSSYTVPFYNDGAFSGFIFLNSGNKNAFNDRVCHGLSPFVHLIGLLVLKEMDQIKVLLSSVTSALDISHHRDPETGAHLQRMSRYARLIANELAPAYGLDDEYVEYLYRFAPLHDVGKIAIPDRILLKPGPLTDQEYEVMKEHASKGREIMDRMLSNFRLEGLKHAGLLRNIIEYHHEAVNGSGYPAGLMGEGIPLEARIVAVADVFDALTSVRPYKPAWSSDDAFAEIERISNKKLDAQCVEVLKQNRQRVEAIRDQFQDEIAT